jgi:hypothetical protein
MNQTTLNYSCFNTQCAYVRAQSNSLFTNLHGYKVLSSKTRDLLNFETCIHHEILYNRHNVSIPAVVTVSLSCFFIMIESHYTKFLMVQRITSHLGLFFIILMNERLDKGT